MAKAKKIKVIHDYFGDPRNTVTSTKECNVVAGVTKWNLIEGQTYKCLRKCHTHLDTHIFEIVNADGEIETYGSIYFK